MMLLTNVKMAFVSIRSSAVRSLLTMIAVIVGVAAFTLITTVVDGLKANVGDQIESFGSNLVQVSPGKSVIRDENGEIVSYDFAAAFGASTLTEKDVETIQKTPGVVAAAPLMMVSGTIERAGKSVTGASIVATNDQYPEAVNQKLATGNFFAAGSNAKQAVIGHELMLELFDGKNPLGLKIELRGEEFTVVGVMEEYESGGVDFGPNLNRFVYIPLGVGKTLAGGSLQIVEIDIKTASAEAVDSVATSLNSSLKANHGGQEDFSVIKSEETLELTNNIFDLMKNLSRTVSYIMLFVGGIVIMLIMLITVSERTREIGIRKSLGATNGNIMVQFLVEALVLTWVGSMLGVAFAFAIGLIVKALADITPVYSLETILLVIIISTLLGTVAGLVPAMRAARKDPVEALRHE